MENPRGIVGGRGEEIEMRPTGRQGGGVVASTRWRRRAYRRVACEIVVRILKA